MKILEREAGVVGARLEEVIELMTEWLVGVVGPQRRVHQEQAQREIRLVKWRLRMLRLRH